MLQFSDLLRYNLYEADVDLVDLGREAVYLENYVALQKARSSPTLQVVLRLEIENSQSRIAPLLFIPFVENAFKFSSHEESREKTVAISLLQKDNNIIFECRNSYEEEGRGKGGIGLNNVKRRLELSGQFENTVKAGDYLRDNPADIMFLDIEMPRHNGLQYLKGTAVIPLVILTTAYPEYALEGMSWTSKIDAIEGNTIKIKGRSVPISRNYRDTVMELVSQRLLKR